MMLFYLLFRFSCGFVCNLVARFVLMGGLLCLLVVVWLLFFVSG